MHHAHWPKDNNAWLSIQYTDAPNYKQNVERVSAGRSTSLGASSGSLQYAFWSCLIKRHIVLKWAVAGAAFWSSKRFGQELLATDEYCGKLINHPKCQYCQPWKEALLLEPPSHQTHVAWPPKIMFAHVVQYAQLPPVHADLVWRYNKHTIDTKDSAMIILPKCNYKPGVDTRPQGLLVGQLSSTWRYQE